MTAALLDGLQQVTGLYVFETERGRPLSVDALQYIVREAGREARLDVAVHPHMLRHAAGYTLANDGVDTRLIQDFLGHVDIRHTAHYTALFSPPAWRPAATGGHHMGM
jgi:site-specific recombinase XerD